MWQRRKYILVELRTTLPTTYREQRLYLQGNSVFIASEVFAFNVS